MLKPILLASAMMISAPALAQEVPSQMPSSPSTQTTAPTSDPAAQAPTTTQESLPDATTADPTANDPASTAQTTPPQSTEQPAQSAEAGQPQAATSTQIAQIVDAEFPTYDKDSDGEITQPEFASWMVKLRQASDPSTDAQSAEVQSWIGQAFASADADKSTKVSKTELTTFLSQGAS